jgi:hypothetical protein
VELVVLVLKEAIRQYLMAQQQYSLSEVMEVMEVMAQQLVEAETVVHLVLAQQVVMVLQPQPEQPEHILTIPAVVLGAL